MAGGSFAGLVTAPVSKVFGLFLHTPRLARAPIALYRAGFGWLLGSRMLMLEHLGRKSGLCRYVVLEVLAQPRPDSYIVASGFGESSQWFRNVMADPQVRISAGKLTSAPAQARRLSPGEADAALADYIERHPQSWAALKRVIDQSFNGRTDPPGSELPLVELTLRPQ